MINIRRISDHITLGILDTELFAKGNNMVNKREIEQSGTGFLLKNIYPHNTPALAYTLEKKPFFSNSYDQLSITHSHGKLAILVNTKESCGVDIELIRDKILNIKRKFLSEHELSFAGDNPSTLTIMWAAKEAIYKAYGRKQVDFISHMRVEPFNETQTEIIGWFCKDGVNKKYLLKREILGQHALVYTLNEV